MRISDMIENKLSLLSYAVSIGDAEWAEEIKHALANLVETRNFVAAKKRDYSDWGE